LLGIGTAEGQENARQQKKAPTPHAVLLQDETLPITVPVSKADGKRRRN